MKDGDSHSRSDPFTGWYHSCTIDTLSKGDLPGLYVFVSGFAMCAPIIVAQSYLETATGKLTKLENIYQLENYEPTKYYSLKNFYIDEIASGRKFFFNSNLFSCASQ